MKFSGRFYTFCGILMLASEIWKQWTLTFTINDGAYIWWYFPFQLCSIPMYVCLAVGLSGSSFIRRYLPAFLMDFGMLGGVFAFFDTSGMHYSYPPLTVHSYAWHILLIALGCYSGLDPETDRSFKGYRFSLILYLVCCGAATIWNLVFYRFGAINMFYISPHYDMRQKVFCHIADAFGNGYGIAAYIAASALGAGLLHLMWNRICENLRKA